MKKTLTWLSLIATVVAIFTGVLTIIKHFDKEPPMVQSISIEGLKTVSGNIRIEKGFSR
jgi:hypothetical protein